jgi:hypothetical protein
MHLPSLAHTLWVVLFLVTATPLAQAQIIGDREAGMAGAAVATGKEASAFWVNPAGLARLRHQALSVSASAFKWDRSDFGGIYVIDTPSERGESQGKSAGFFSFPAILVYAYPFELWGIEQTLAAGVVEPESGERRGTESIGLPDENFIYSFSTFEQSSVMAPGISYAARLGPLSLGISAYLSYATSVYETHEYFGDLDGTEDANTPSYMSLSLTSEETRVAGLLAQLGGQYAITDSIHLGATVKPPSLHVYGAGTYRALNFAGDPTDSDFCGDATCWTFVDEAATDEVVYRAPTGWVAQLAGGYRGESFAVEVGGGYDFGYRDQLVRESVNVVSGDENVTLDEALATRSPSANFNAGTEFIIDEKMAIRTGVYSSIDIRDRPAASEDAVGDTRFRTIGFSMGGGYLRGNSSTSLSLDYTYSFGETVGIHLDERGDVEETNFRRVPVSAGTFAIVLSSNVDIENIFQ